MDVNALHTSIDQEEATEMLKYFLEKRQHCNPPTEFILEMASHVLKKCYFKFGKQKFGSPGKPYVLWHVYI